MIRRFSVMSACMLASFLLLPVAVPGSAEPRSLTMKETLRIGDETGGFLFKNPSDLKVNARGDVFVQGDDQILHFDAQGKFIANLVKNGEGPGEVKYMGEYQFDGDSRILSNMMPLKIMFFDGADKLSRELKVSGLQPFSNYLLTLNGIHYCIEENVDFQKIKTGINTRRRQVYAVDGQGKAAKTPLFFDTLDVDIIRTEKGQTFVAMNEITRFLSACDGQKFVYVVSDDLYRIRQFDWPAQKPVREIRLDYARQAYIPRPDADKQDQEMERMAGRKFFNDIWALRILGKDLLVITSQIDPQKGVRVDRFNTEGRLVDSVYIEIPGVKRPDDLKRKPLFFRGDEFWTVFVDEDDNPVLVRYHLGWKPS